MVVLSDVPHGALPQLTAQRHYVLKLSFCNGGFLCGKIKERVVKRVVWLNGKNKRSKRGFTTVELLAVVAILTILLALAAPNIIQSWKGLQITELDGTAREIFLTAQNELTEKKTSDALQKLTADSEVIQNDSITEDGVTKTIYYITSEEVGDSLGRLKALFSTLPGGSVLLVNPRTGDVTDVYYSKKPLTYTEVAELREELGGTDNRDLRAKKGIGYYGGIVTTSPTPGEPEEPNHLPETLELVNGEDLYVKLVYPELGEAMRNPEKVLASIQITDESGVSITRSADGTSAVKSNEESDTEFSRWKSSIYAGVTTGNDYTLYVLLDSLVDGKAFSTLFPTLNAGDDITVQVSLSYNGKSLYKNAMVGKVNSLYGAKYEANDTVDGIFHKKGVEFSRVRHLSNLRYYSMGVGTAAQTGDIDFTRSVRQATMMPITEHVNTAPAWFTPISLTDSTKQNGLIVDGKDGNETAHTLSNFQIQSSISALFGACSVSADFQNLRLLDVRSTGEQIAGSLIGKLSGDSGNSKVLNCGAYQSSAGKGFVTGGRSSSSGSERPTGGLIGLIEAKNGNAVIIKNSFSALPVSNYASQSGGLIGSVRGGSSSAPVEIQNSYSSVTVISGHLGVYYKTAGGLVGSTSGYTRITDSYSTADVAASENSGALVGINTGNLSVSSSYACGLVATNGATAYGPLAFGGTITYTDSSYLLQSGNSEASDAYGGSAPAGVTALEYDALAKDSTGHTILNSVDKCHPYAEALKNKAYPFRMVTDEYYGDWPEVFAPSKGKPPYSLCYYERYTNGTWGFYGFDSNGVLADTLDYKNDSVIATTGYGIIVPAGTQNVVGPNIGWGPNATLGEKIAIPSLQRDLYPLPNAATDLQTHVNQRDRSVKDLQAGRSIYINPFFGAALSLNVLQVNESLPMQIRTEEQLRERNRISDSGWYFKQTHNITVTKADTGGFINNTGCTYDGGGNLISGLQQPLVSTNMGPLKNLELTNVSINKSGDTAALVQTNQNVVSNCVVRSGSIVSTYGSASGLIHTSNGGTITGCAVGTDSTNVTVTGGGQYAAGMISSIGGGGPGILNCRVTNTTVTNSNGLAAGLVGSVSNLSTGSVTNNTVSASVTVTGASAAGFAGQNAWNATIQNSSTAATVTSLQSGGAAGFVLQNSGGVVRLSYASGSVTAQNNGNASGFFDSMEGGNVSDSYHTGAVSAKGNGSASGFGRALRQGNVSNCFAVGRASSTGGTATGFLQEITQYNGFVNKSYAAVALTFGSTGVGFTRSTVSATDCYWVRQFGGFNSGVDTVWNQSGRVTSISFDTLRQMQLYASGWSWDTGDQSWTMVTTPAQTHPATDAQKGQAYPYPRIKGLEYYGDWPIS